MRVKPRYVSATDKRVQAQVEATGMEEYASFVGDRPNQHGLRFAIDPVTNQVLTHVLAKPTYAIFKELKALIELFHVALYLTDSWGEYIRRLVPNNHDNRKHKIQSIERKNLKFRSWIKRLARRTIGLSKLEIMHNMIIERLINKVEFETHFPAF